MSDDNIKGLVERLDEHWGSLRLGDMSSLFADAADALEAMAEKLQRETKAAGYWMERFCAAENERDQMLIDLEEYRRDVEALVKERDRLKAALQEIADTLNRGPDINRNWGVKYIYDIAREALEAKQAEPAPAVCEWDSRTTVFPMPTCNPAAAFLNRIHRDGDMCPLCCKPIKFTEAKE